MEINLPPDPNVKVEIAESNLMTVRVSDKGVIYWNFGLDAPKIIDHKDLRAFLTEKQAAIPKLTVLLKIDRQGKYKMMVDLIDEFNLSHVQRFSLAPLGDKDKELMAKVQG
jgi:biopolymer transport protein ExbD